MKKERLTLISLLFSKPHLTILAIISLCMSICFNIRIRSYSGKLTDLILNHEAFIGILFKIIELLLIVVFFTFINKYIVKKICMFLSKKIISRIFKNLNEKDEEGSCSFLLTYITDIERYIKYIFTGVFLDVFFFFITFKFIYEINVWLPFIILLIAFIPIILLIKFNKMLTKIWNESNINNLKKNFCYLITIVITVIYGIELVKNAYLTFGNLLVVILLVNYIVCPLIRFNDTIEIIKKGEVALSNLNKDLLSSKKKEDAIICDNKETVVEFKNVYYFYDGEVSSVNNLNFTLKKGQVFLITGFMADKRDYIIKLLIGIIKPHKGEISLYGEDLSSYDCEYIRSQISIVSKRTALYSGTIYENILMTNPKSTKNEVEQACKLAGIHDEILNFENGYHTQVGQNGYGISEKMRLNLSIARAFLKNPPILILDESYTIIDPYKKEKIYYILSTLCKDKTVIVIAKNNFNDNKDMTY